MTGTLADLRFDDRFVRELETGVYEPEVRHDFRNGVRSGVNGTPGLFINGQRYDAPRDLYAHPRNIFVAGFIGSTLALRCFDRPTRAGVSSRAFPPGPPAWMPDARSGVAQW